MCMEKCSVIPDLESFRFYPGVTKVDHHGSIFRLFIYLFRNLLSYPFERHWATDPSASFGHSFLDQWVPRCFTTQDPVSEQSLTELCGIEWGTQPCTAAKVFSQSLGSASWHAWAAAGNGLSLKLHGPQYKSSPEVSEKRESYCLYLGGRAPLGFHFCLWYLGREYCASDIDYLHLGTEAAFLASKGLQEETRHGRKGRALMSFL